MNKEFNLKDLMQIMLDLSLYEEAFITNFSEAYKLTSGQYLVLNDVYHHDGTHVGGICERLYKQTNTISPLIKKLISLGYLEKKDHEVDHRVVLVYCTEKTKTLMFKMGQSLDNICYKLFSKYSDNELKKIFNSLTTLKDIVKELNL